MDIKILIFTNPKDAEKVIQAIDQMQANPEFMNKAMALFTSIQRKTFDNSDLR